MGPFTRSLQNLLKYYNCYLNSSLQIMDWLRKTKATFIHFDINFDIVLKELARGKS